MLVREVTEGKERIGQAGLMTFKTFWHIRIWISAVVVLVYIAHSILASVTSSLVRKYSDIRPSPLGERLYHESLPDAISNR